MFETYSCYEPSFFSLEDYIICSGLSFVLKSWSVCNYIYLISCFASFNDFYNNQCKEIRYEILCIRISYKLNLFSIFQLVGCVGAILWSKLSCGVKWKVYVQFAVFGLGVYSSRIWTAFLAITLLFLQCRSLCFVLKLKPIFVVLGWG